MAATNPADPGVGFEYPPRKVSWMKRDVLLFANSIGVKVEDLHFLYELHSNFSVFPTYPTVLSQKGDATEIPDFHAQFLSKGQGIQIPGVPRLDAKRMVDGGRAVKILKPLPPSSEGKQFELRMRVAGVWDKGKAGTIVQTETSLVDAGSGDVYTVLTGNSFYIGQGGWGGPKGPSATKYPLPKRAPDATYTISTTEETPLLYRLNGDSNPLHVVPEPGRQMGFSGAIIHGLYSYNATAYAVLKCMGDGVASARADILGIREFEAKFASPVEPGDKLVVEIWGLGEVVGGGYEQGEALEEVRFVSKVVKKGTDGREAVKDALVDGRAVFRRGKEKGKL